MMEHSAPATLTIDPAQFRGRHIHLAARHHPGMRSVGALLQAFGAKCTGCETPQPTAPCPHLRQSAPDLLVAPPAFAYMPASHPDLTYAAERDIPVMPSPWLLGALLADHCVCAVVGPQAPQSAAWLTRFLAQGGLDAHAVDALADGERWHQGRSDLWVVTTGAAYGTFLSLHPCLALITGIPDEAVPGYGDPAAVQRAFDAFIAGMDLYRSWPFAPTVILNDDDAGCRLLAARMAAWPGRVVRYRQADGGHHTPGGATKLAMRIPDRDGGEARFTVPLAARPHLPALLGAIFAARHAHVAAEAIAGALHDATAFNELSEMR